MKKLRFLKYFIPLLLMVFACQARSKNQTSGFKISIDAKNLSNDNLILTYPDDKGQQVRLDFSLDNKGYAAIVQDKDVKENTFCRMIIKGKTEKSNAFKDYSLGSYLYFFVSNGSEVHLVVDQFDEFGGLSYQIKDKTLLNNQVNDFNNAFLIKTKPFRINSSELNKIRQKRRGNQDNQERANDDRIKLEELYSQSKNLLSDFQYVVQYIEQNNNELSAYFLYNLYTKRLLDDDFVNNRLKTVPEKNSDSQYILEVKALLKDRLAYSEGKYIKDISEKTLNGETFDLKNVKKTFILVDFWATWCGPCKAGMPKMKAFYEQNKNQLEMVSVCCKDKEQNWRSFLKEHPQYNWIQLLDASGEIVKTFNVEAYPTKFLLDKEGKILYKMIGEADADYAKMETLILNKNK